MLLFCPDFAAVHQQCPLGSLRMLWDFFFFFHQTAYVGSSEDFLCIGICSTRTNRELHVLASFVCGDAQKKSYDLLYLALDFMAA